MRSQVRFVSALLRPRRWRFSLRVLLGMVLLLACAMGAVAWRMRAAKIQHDTVAELRKRNVSLVYRHQLRGDGNPIDRDAEPPGPAWLRTILGDDFFAHVDRVSVVTFNFPHGGPVADFDDSLVHLLARLRSLRILRLGSTRTTDEHLILLGKLNNLRSLSLNNTRITDDGLTHLRAFKKLEDLNLSQNDITGAGLAHLRGLPHLKNLDLNGTQVGDEHAEEVGRFTQLRKLNLRHTRISDRALKHLEQLVNLEELDVGGVTQITDEGLSHLCKMTWLKHLNVRAKRVTTDGTARLRQALPECEVIGRGLPR
jgi:hypothetical protein